MDWNEPGPGYLEIDLVAHGGGAVSGYFIHSILMPVPGRAEATNWDVVESHV